MEEIPRPPAAEGRSQRAPRGRKREEARWANIRGERRPAPVVSPWWLGAVVVGILVARRPDAFTNPQFWAEDGPIFFLTADLLGWRSLLEPYAGYLHSLNRVVALVVSQVDPAWAPTGYMLASLTGTVITAVRFLSPRLDLPVRPAFAVSLVLLPSTGEVFFNLTNLQWWTAIWLVQLALMRPARTPRDSIIDLAVAFFAGLSGPFCLLLWPLFAWRCWDERTRAAGALLAMISLTATIQLWFLVQSTRRPDDAEWSLLAAATVTVQRTAGALLFGPHAATSVATGVGVATLGVVAFSLHRRTADPYRRARLTLAFVWGALLLPVWVVVRIDRLDIGDLVSGDRYFFVPRLVLVWLALLEVSRSTRAARVVLVGLAFGFVINAPALRWPVAPDREWNRYVPALRAGRAVTIPINPDWTFEHPGRPRR